MQNITVLLQVLILMCCGTPYFFCIKSQDMGVPRSGKKPTESFMHWKKPTSLERKGAKPGVSVSSSGDKGKYKEKLMSTKKFMPALSSKNVNTSFRRNRSKKWDKRVFKKSGTEICKLDACKR